MRETNDVWPEKTILITGSAGILGSRYVAEFLERGAKVIATDLPGDLGAQLAARYANNSAFRYFDLDVTSESQISAVFDEIEHLDWGLNTLVNNAAITSEFLVAGGRLFPNFSETTMSDWSKTIDVNLNGPFLMAREFDRRVVGRRPSKLINISSMYALRGPHHDLYHDSAIKSFAAYSASKAGIHGLTVWLASYWADRNCTVNSLAPGGVYNNHERDFEYKLSNLTSIGRMAKPKEIAGALSFLVSSDSDYMNGQILHVDGGFSSW